jgi:ubiquinone/menaquinone biosynthesis C-methylase UbiE
VLPTLWSWPELRERYREEVRGSFDELRYASRAHREQDLRFVESRLDEGVAIASFLQERFGSRPLRILDLGTGNAAVAAALANITSYRVVAADHSLQSTAPAVISACEVPVRFIAASGERLPFPDERFEVVLALETLEHVPDTRAFAQEISRVMSTGGMCVLTTPARLRYLFRRDPHFGIPGLLMLPDRMQKRLAAGLLKVVRPDEYDVEHIYWYAGTIARLFGPGHQLQAVGSPPANAMLRKAWSYWQRVVWERLVIVKK